jgi:hypothetical protein
MVEDLRGEIERLRCENERLADEISGLREVEEKEDKKGRGGEEEEEVVSGAKKEKVMVMEIEREDTDGEDSEMDGSSWL